MNKILALLMAMALTACAGGGKESDKEGGQKPTPKPTLHWGDLSCQKAGSCRNPVLHLKKADLIAYFDRFFSKPQTRGEKEIFSCGVKTYDTWAESFGPQPPDDFLPAILQLDTCSYEKDLSDKLEIYFQNTKEYQDEIAH